MILCLIVLVELGLVADTDRHRHGHRPMASTADAEYRAVKTQCISWHFLNALTRKRKTRNFQSRYADVKPIGVLCIRGTSHGPVSVCLCLSVSVCVCLLQVGVLLKRLNVGSHKQHHTIARDSRFLTPKISAKFDLRGRRMQVGWVKIGDF